MPLPVPENGQLPRHALEVAFVGREEVVVHGIVVAGLLARRPPRRSRVASAEAEAELLTDLLPANVGPAPAGTIGGEIGWAGAWCAALAGSLARSNRVGLCRSAAAQYGM
jgi:hypothetical protein